MSITAELGQGKNDALANVEQQRCEGHGLDCEGRLKGYGIQMFDLV